jgi:hypothetical protein
VSSCWNFFKIYVEVLPVRIMGAYRGSSGIARQSVLTSAVDRSERSISRRWRFTPGKEAGTQWMCVWVGPGEAAWTVWRREKTSCPCRDSNPGSYSTSRSLVTVPTALFRLLRCGKCFVICDIPDLVLRQPEVAIKIIQCHTARSTAKVGSRPSVASTECDVQQAAAMRWWPWQWCVGMSGVTFGTHTQVTLCQTVAVSGIETSGWPRYAWLQRRK